MTEISLINLKICFQISDEIRWQSDSPVANLHVWKIQLTWHIVQWVEKRFDFSRQKFKLKFLELAYQFIHII